MPAQILSRAHPHVDIPGIIAPQIQKVPFKSYIGGKTNFGNLSAEVAYMMTLKDINSETQVGQQWGTKQPAKQTYTLGQISAPYYRISAYVEYDAGEVEKFGSLVKGVALPDFLESLAKQGINQRRHQAILWGFDSNQGILSNGTKTTLPTDSSSVKTLTGYNPAELQAFLSSVMRDALNASYGTLVPSVIAGPSRVINYLASAIIPLTQSQKEGAGVDSVSGLFSRVNNWLGVGDVTFIQDNNLEGAGSNSSDLLVFIAPGLQEQTYSLDEDESENLLDANSITYNTWVDEAQGLMRWDAQPDMGVFAHKYTFKMTPGVSLRSEAVRIIEVPYQ